MRSDLKRSIPGGRDFAAAFLLPAADEAAGQRRRKSGVLVVLKRSAFRRPVSALPGARPLSFCLNKKLLPPDDACGPRPAPRARVDRQSSTLAARRRKGRSTSAAASLEATVGRHAQSVAVPSSVRTPLACREVCAHASGALPK